MEPASENFLRNVALGHEKNDISRTYLFLEKTNSDVNTIKGFFTVAVKCLAIGEHHCIPDGISRQMNIDRGIAQSYLLGQLAKADGAEKGFGREMISRALGIFSKNNEMVGCRVARLDCRDDLLEYYKSCGFAFIGKNQNGILNQMVVII